MATTRVILEIVDSDDCAPKVPVKWIRAKKGADAVFTIEAAPTAGYAGDMDLSVSGVPSGATSAFASSTIAYNESTTLTIDTGTATAGTYTLDITGEGPA